MKKLSSIERKSEYIRGQHCDTKICVDRRFEGTPTVDNSRVRISIFKKVSQSVELRPDDAIEFFEQGIAYARALKASLS